MRCLLVISSASRPARAKSLERRCFVFLWCRVAYLCRECANCGGLTCMQLCHVAPKMFHGVEVALCGHDFARHFFI
jgi:hypothetical protein